MPGAQEGGERIELRVFALAEIPVAEFEKAKKDYLHRLAGNSEIKKVLADVGAKQRDKVMKGTETTENGDDEKAH